VVKPRALSKPSPVKIPKVPQVFDHILETSTKHRKLSRVPTDWEILMWTPYYLSNRLKVVKLRALSKTSPSKIPKVPRVLDHILEISTKHRNFSRVPTDWEIFM